MSLIAAQISSFDDADDLVDRLPARSGTCARRPRAPRRRRRRCPTSSSRTRRPAASDWYIASASIRLDADHPHVRPQRLDVAGDAGDQAAAADRHEDRRHVAGLWRRISSPIVPWPAMTSGSSNGWTNVEAGLGARARRSAPARRRSCRRPARPRRPSSRTASTLISGVVCGMTMTARMPRWRAENATPCAWLPALAAMTPRARSAVGQVRDAVVGAAQLEAEDRLQVLALEQHVVAEPRRQPRRRVERRLLRHVVDAARQDQPQHRVGIRTCSVPVVGTLSSGPCVATVSERRVNTIVEDACGGDFRAGARDR